MAGTARRRQRPPAATQQREHDSGKKQTHTDTTIVLVHETTDTVVYRGPTVGGKTHAKKAADAAAIAYPPHATGAKDTGFQGYEPAGVQTRQPKQKPRNQELSGAERRLNRIFSSARVVVEHAIAGVQRGRLGKAVLRLTQRGIAALVMEIACGLHTLRMTYRHPLPAFSVLSLLN
jgi:hypothetical protein